MLSKLWMTEVVTRLTVPNTEVHRRWDQRRWGGNGCQNGVTKPGCGRKELPVTRSAEKATAILDGDTMIEQRTRLDHK